MADTFKTVESKSRKRKARQMETEPVEADGVEEMEETSNVVNSLPKFKPVEAAAEVGSLLWIEYYRKLMIHLCI